MNELPRPTLDAAIQDLAMNESFRVVIGYIRSEREQLIADLGPCEKPFDVMKISGGISRLDELLRLLDPGD